VREAAADQSRPDLAVLGVGINDVWRCFQNRPDQAVQLAEYNAAAVTIGAQVTDPSVRPGQSCAGLQPFLGRSLECRVPVAGSQATGPARRDSTAGETPVEFASVLVGADRAEAGRVTCRRPGSTRIVPVVNRAGGVLLCTWT
jgi:hypothetical protein